MTKPLAKAEKVEAATTGVAQTKLSSATRPNKSRSKVTSTAGAAPAVPRIEATRRRKRTTTHGRRLKIFALDESEENSTFTSFQFMKGSR